MMRRLTFYLAVGLLITLYAALKLLIAPPVPSSVVTMYMVLAALGVAVFVGANEERFAAFKAPLAAVFCGRAPRWVQGLVFVTIPLLVAGATWLRVAPTWDAPYVPRVIHPEPPQTVVFKGQRMALAGLQNPLRAKAGELETHIEQGKKIYYQNCFYCHGDALAGDGHFANAFTPIPANFRDVGTISMLQESYVFWRVATGGPGLPKGATPWNSAMPAWQNFLSEEQIWQVILFIYEGSGSTPRTWEDGGHK